MTHQELKKAATEFAQLRHTGREFTGEGKQAWRQLTDAVYRAGMTKDQCDRLAERAIKTTGIGETDNNGHAITWDGLEIVSGEGNGKGYVEPYTGRRTRRALAARLTRERCDGERWAYARNADEPNRVAL